MVKTGEKYAYLNFDLFGAQNDLQIWDNEAYCSCTSKVAPISL